MKSHILGLLALTNALAGDLLIAGLRLGDTFPDSLRSQCTVETGRYGEESAQCPVSAAPERLHASAQSWMAYIYKGKIVVLHTTLSAKGDSQYLHCVAFEAWQAKIAGYTGTTMTGLPHKEYFSCADVGKANYIIKDRASSEPSSGHRVSLWLTSLKERGGSTWEGRLELSTSDVKGFDAYIEADKRTGMEKALE